MCEGNRTTYHVQYALGFSSIAQPFDSLCSKVFDEHPTVAPPKEQKFCAATSQNHSVSPLDTTAQINSKSTVDHKCARPSIDHHRRRPTSHKFLWPSGSCHVRTILAYIQFLVKLIWTTIRTSLNRGPDALLSVAQIKRCVTETPQRTSRYVRSAILPFAFLPSAAVGTRKGITD